MSLRTRPAGGAAGNFGNEDNDAVLQEREQLGEALRALVDAVIVVDTDGNELLRNDAAERFRDGRHSDAREETEATIGKAREAPPERQSCPNRRRLLLSPTWPAFA